MAYTDRRRALGLLNHQIGQQPHLSSSIYNNASKNTKSAVPVQSRIASVNAKPEPVKDILAEWKHQQINFRQNILKQDKSFIHVYENNCIGAPFVVKFKFDDLLESEIPPELLLESEAFNIIEYMREIEFRYLSRLTNNDQLQKSLTVADQSLNASKTNRGYFPKKLYNSATLHMDKANNNIIPSDQKVNIRVRYIIVDWLVEVHQQFDLSPETLFLSVALLDLYLVNRAPEMRRNQIQPVACACLLIASKLEEVYPVTSQDLSQMMESQVSSAEIITYEQKVLLEVGFKLTLPTPIAFERRYSRLLCNTRAERSLNKYFMELTMLDVALACRPPSERAAISCLLSRLLTLMAGSNEQPTTNEEPKIPLTAGELDGLLASVWNPELSFHSGYSVEVLRRHLGVLVTLVLRQHLSSPQRNVRDKYAKPENECASSSGLLRDGYLEQLETHLSAGV